MTAVLPPPVRGVHIGPEAEPEMTLGWQVLAWTRKYLLQPDGPDAGEPWKFTREQMLFVLNWYAVDAHGKFVYRSGMLRRAKGWGKDPLGAALACVEFVGPCRFSHWVEGKPVAIPHSAPWIQTAAVSQEQTRNTTTLLPAMLSQRAVSEYKIELGKTLVYALGGRARLEAVTSSPKALEGGRASFTLKNETHWWGAANEGHAMAAVIARNAAKARDGSSRVLAISNAHNPGEDSDAERDFEAYQKIASGRSRATGFLYDSLEAPPDTELADRESLRAGILAARGDSYWLDPDRLIEEIYDPRTPPSTARRFYLNQIVASEDAWLSPQEWDVCAKPEEQVAPGEIITLGFDGSLTDDHSVLTGCRVSDSHLFPLGAWDPATYADNQIPMADVDVAVARAFETYDVVGFYSDVHPFETYVAKWEQERSEGLCAKASFNHAIEWDMRRSKDAAYTAQEYHDAIMQRDLSHANDPAMNQYHYNARRRPTNWEGVVTFGKETAFSSRKVDGVASGMLARKARQDYLALPESKKRQVVGPSVYEDRGLRRL